MLINYNEKNEKDIYNLVSQTVIPRPIAWIMTQNEKGLLNIAPFSYFIPLSSSPASLIVSIGHKSNKKPKDTLQNIRDSKKCTICICDESFLNNMNSSASELDANKSEIDIFNIDTTKILDDFPPIVKDIPSAFFCTLIEEVNLQNSKTIPLILEIKQQYVNNNNFSKKNNKINIQFNPIARVGRYFKKLGKKLETKN